MKNLSKRFLSFVVALSFLVSLVGCNIKTPEEPLELEPSASVLNEISWNDVDPAILIRGENIIFDAKIAKNDIQLAGALRNLTLNSVAAVDNSTLLISTSGSVYSDDACGRILISKDSNSTGAELSLEVSMERSNYGKDLFGAGFLADLGLGLLKGVVVTGAEKAFGYGLDKLLYDKLGINIVTLKTLQLAINELSNKIDALSDQITEMEGRLTDVINESTKAILTNEYLNTFDHINSLVTSIKSDTLSLWNDIATIQSTADETSEEYRTLIIAELLTFSELEGKNVSPLVSNVAEAISYIDGSYFSMNPESLYSRFLKIGCTRSVFLGEAAILVSDYLNSLNAIVAEALNVMTIVCQAKYYTYRQLNTSADKEEYKDVIRFVDGEAVESKELIVNLEQLAETDEDLRNRLTSSAVAKYKDKANGSIWQNQLKRIADISANVFDQTNMDSVLSKYNRYVQDCCYSYNKSYTVSGNYITVDSVNLRTAVSSTGSAECGIFGNGAWNDSDYQKKVTEVNRTVNYYIENCMTSEEIGTFLGRLMSNESGLLFRNLTEAKTFTIADVLKIYGFSVPDESNLLCYFATGSSVNTSRGQLTLTGYPTSSGISVDKYGSITSPFGQTEDLVYYRYKDYLENRCYFYYFTEEKLIYTVDDLLDYMDHVINDRPYVSGKLMADLDLSGIDWATVWPVSKANVEFRGIFNGNNHTISNFIYNEGTNSGHSFGFFRKAGKDAVIKNLRFENVQINCENSDNVGACVGEITAACTISGVKVLSGSVKGSSNVAGIVGISKYPNTMSGSMNCADVSGKSYVGGLIGRSNTGGTQVFSSSKNFGKITASAGSAGGIISALDGSVTFKITINEGHVTADKNAGGLVGTLLSAFKATDSENRGTVTSETADAGGLVGSINCKKAITIGNCRNYGNVTASNAAGGFVGNYVNSHAIISHTVETSQNFGVITAKNYAGGFFGYGSYFYLLQIKDSSNSGDVTATVRSAGGLIGETVDVLNLGVVNTPSTGVVSGKKYSGSEVGCYESAKSRIVVQ